MTLTIEVRSRPGKVNELYQTLQALLPTMRKEMGCQACRVTRDVEDGELFFSPVSGMHREASTVIYDPAAAAPCSGPSTCWASRRESGPTVMLDGRGSSR